MKACSSRRQRHRPYKPWPRTRRQAARAAQRSRSEICRVAVLYEPANTASILELKEVLPVAARALGLTVRSWEVNPADGFERVFTALNKDLAGWLDELGGPLLFANENRIVSFALKSRLPSMNRRREAVDAGGLMYYGADLAESYRRAAYSWTKF